jgi:hypothetical protein
LHNNTANARMWRNEFLYWLFCIFVFCQILHISS